MSHTARRGFALVAVLWIIIGVSAMALAMNLAGRDALASAQNRLDGTRARWRAEGCLERARAAIDELLAHRARWVLVPGSWAALDRGVLTSPYLTDTRCKLTMRPTGIALDVNAASAVELVALFRAMGIPSPESTSLAQAVVEWRGDDTSHANRAIATRWYAAHHRLLPRFGPFADVRELRLVREFGEVAADVPDLDTLLTTEPGRVNLTRAPPVVLAALPGITAPLIAQVMARRNKSGQVPEISTIAAGLSADVHDSLADHYQAIRN